MIITATQTLIIDNNALIQSLHTYVYHIEKHYEFLLTVKWRPVNFPQLPNLG